MNGTISPFSVEKIPCPEIIALRDQRGTSRTSIDVRTGTFSISLSDILIIDLEHEKDSEGAWHLTEVAAYKPELNGDAIEFEVRRYRPPHKIGQVAQSLSDLQKTWDTEQISFWAQKFHNRVLIGHNVGADFDKLIEAGLSLSPINTGLIDTLELAQLAFPFNTDERGKKSHSLQSLATSLKLDPEQNLRAPGHRHSASKDAILCWRLVLKILNTLRDWSTQRILAVIQLLPPDCYLRRFLTNHIPITGVIPQRRIPLVQVTGKFPEIPKPAPTSQKLPQPKSAHELLAIGGPFSCSNPKFEFRSVQCELAEAVGGFLEQGGALFAEAGTGTGKSLGALVPALARARQQSSEPVVISTYTHLLQEQLVGKDLPSLEQALGPVKVVVLKGKNNYLDLEALDARRSEQIKRLTDAEWGKSARTEGFFLACLVSWVAEGFELERKHAGQWNHVFLGDLSDLTSSWLAATYGADFTSFLNSFNESLGDIKDATGSTQRLFQRALALACKAELVVVNHALWLTSKAIQNLSSRVIFDEAHHLEEAVTSALTIELTSDKVRGWARVARGIAQGLPEQETARSRLHIAAKTLEESIQPFARLFRDCLDSLLPISVDGEDEDKDEEVNKEQRHARKFWLSNPREDYVPDLRKNNRWLDAKAGECLLDAIDCLRRVMSEVQNVDESTSELISKVFCELEDGFFFLSEVLKAIFPNDHRFCWWLEEDSRELRDDSKTASHFRLCRAPVRVDEIVKDLLLADHRATVLISATLSLRGGELLGPVSIKAQEAQGFLFLAERLGLTCPNRVYAWSRPSPFEYRTNLRVLLRCTVRQPSDPEERIYLQEIHAELLNLLRNSPSRGLILFTSRRHLHALADALRNAIDDPKLGFSVKPDLFIREPGESAIQAVTRYRNRVEDGKNALLLGTGSFWEGLDLSGTSKLHTLVIVRLPFPAAGEPIIQARTAQVETQNSNDKSGGFQEFLLPLALIRWRQGVGRLIRDHASRGVLVCLDRRAASSTYAHQFWRALPSGPSGEPERKFCLSRKELIWEWAAFKEESKAEWLDIRERPWEPQTVSLPRLQSSRPIGDISQQLAEGAHQMIGNNYQTNNIQMDAMTAFATGRDVLLVMPTGGGKSLCYQIPALMAMEGLTVVFSPLRALIQNQINGLREKGIPVPDCAAYLLGKDAQDPAERRKIRQFAEDGHLRLLYLTPEMASRDFTLFARYHVKRIVFDEAHCLLSWGESFRSDYLRLAKLVRDSRRKDLPNVPVMACSATLSLSEQHQLSALLGMHEPVKLAGNTDRPNLYWGVDFPSESYGVGTRDRHLQAVLATLPEGSQAIVYTTYIRTSERLASDLRRNGFRAAAYHGKLPGYTKDRVLDRFTNGSDDLQIVIATKAFGMGIDNHRVVLVVHYNHPDSLSDYYQQAGRAGRDRNLQAMAITLFDKSDREQHEFLHNTNMLQTVVLDQLLEIASEGGTPISESDLANQMGISEEDPGRLLRQALELLSRNQMISFREIVNSAKLVPDLALTIESADLLSKPLDELYRKWSEALLRDGKFHYIVTWDAPQETWEEAEALLSKGVANRWWRVLDSRRAFWLQREKVNKSTKKVLEDELAQFRSELDQVVYFLNEDTTCRRTRLVRFFNSCEQPLTTVPCCDVCQVELGLGHPWLNGRLLSRPRYDLQSLESLVFTELDGNQQQEELFAIRLLRAIKGSHLAHRDRILAYLEKLRQQGFANCVGRVWGLSKRGQQCLETRSFPTWEKLHGVNL